MSTVNQNFRLFEDVAISSAAYRVVDRIETLYETVSETVSTWTMRQRNRRYLSQMDDRMLQDIGLTRFDVEMEANKHFWQN